MNSPQSSPPPAWKPQEAAAARKESGGPRWHSEPEAVPRAVARRRWKLGQIIPTMLAFAVCCGLLVWVSFWIRPARFTSLILLGAGYQDNLGIPHNVYGLNGLLELENLAQKAPPGYFWDPGWLRPGLKLRTVFSAAGWEQDLDKVKGRTIMVFLALHGGADHQGAYLLPQNALAPNEVDGTPERNFLRLEKVLDEMAKLARQRKVLLVLDATQIQAHWPLGMLHNEFVRGLERLEERILKIDNLVVLCASAADQRSCVSEELGQTVFGHYVLEGLKGAADQAPGDGRINALELYRYVYQQVRHWAQVNRDAVQTPVLYPRGAAGEKRAEQIHLNMVANGYLPPDLGKAASFDALPEAARQRLQEAWKKLLDLDQQLPPPAAYAPEQWRSCLARLLRYEELLLARDVNAADSMYLRLQELGQNLSWQQGPELFSVLGTLGMWAAQGQHPPTHPALVPLCTDLWTTQPKDYAKSWAGIRKNLPAAAGSHWRHLLLQFLLERAADDPAQNLEKTYQLLQVVQDPARLPAAEVQFLSLLRRDLPRRQEDSLSGPAGSFLLPPELLQLALRVRLRAELAALGVQDRPPVERKTLESYPYAEQVMPWIAGLVAQGDALRRPAQDLLFATDHNSWNKSASWLRQAEKLYQQAQEQALRVRRAAAIRDRVVPLLPYYARWLAQRRVLQEDKLHAEHLAQLQKMETLCRQVHRLLAMLEAAPPATAAAQTINLQLGQLSDQADLVFTGFNDLEKWARLFRQNLDEVDLPTVWREIDAALTVPFGDIDTRLKLLGIKSRIAQNFLKQTRGLPLDTLPAPAAAVVAEGSKEAGRRQGRLALALLGQRWFDDCGADLEDFVRVQHRLETFAVEERWWESLREAGRQIGLRWQDLPPQINRLVDRVRQGSADQAASDLYRADRLGRIVTGYGAQFLADPPANLLRQVLTAQLLVLQARRALEDHLFAEDPAQEPYYRTAGLAFVNDARRLPDLRFALPDPRLAELEKKLKQPGELLLQLREAPGYQPSPSGGQTETLTPLLNLTSEEEFPLQYRLWAPAQAEVPPGLPVLWVETGPSLDLRVPLPGSHRLVQEVKPGSDLLVPCAVASPLVGAAEKQPPDSPRVTESFCTLRGLYRGQLLSAKVRLDVQPTPRLTVVDFPLPLKGSVAVRAPRQLQAQFGAGNGALAIVLDCSGSMGPLPARTFDKDTKYAEATAALRQVLRKLPTGTTVSLWVFGQALGPQKTVEQAEQTIQQVLPPTTWNSEDPTQLTNLLERLDYPALEPWNESPIVRTMLMAAQDLRQAAGFKTLLVLTDGMDNRFAKDSQYNSTRKDIRTVLRENFRDVEVNIVGFKVVSKEEEEAKKQFQIIEQLPIPGRFYLVTQSSALVATLEKVLRQKLRYWVDREDNRPLGSFAQDGLNISSDGSNDQWYPGGLAPGGYKARVHTNRRWAKSFALNQADLLLLELVPKTGGLLDFDRVLFSQADFPWKPAKEKGNWRLAALQNQRLAERRLQMLITLEKKSDRLADTLQQIRPLLTWLEVTPADDDQDPPVQRWHFQPGYPAPAWSLEVPRWPTSPGTQAPVKPRLRAWFNPDQAPPPSAVLERGHDFLNPADLVSRPLRVNDDNIIVESVQVEEHLVQTEAPRRDQPGRRELKPCLVLRLRHARHNPVFVRLKGLTASGCEHRYYSDAGKYAALFWPVTRDEAVLTLRSIEIVSLAAFKRDAEQRHFWIELNNLNEPQPGDTRPLSPVDLHLRTPRLDLEEEDRPALPDSSPRPTLGPPPRFLPGLMPPPPPKQKSLLWPPPNGE